MIFPTLIFTDISLLFGICCVVLLITTEFIATYNGIINLPINQEKLEKASIVLGIAFALSILFTMGKL